MVDLKSKQTTTQEQTPVMAEGMKFSKILGAKFSDTRYKKKDGTTQQVVTIQAIRDGQTTPSGYHSTASAVVDILHQHFTPDNKETLDNCEVVEIRSKDGRNYLSLKGY